MGKSSGGGGSSNTTTVQKSEPWEEQKPYLQQMFEDARNLYTTTGMAPPYYGGNTVAGQDPYTTQAIGLQAQRALAGNPAMQAGEGQLSRTMAGDYLDNNPFMAGNNNQYLDDMVARAQNQTLANVAGNFSQAGRYGSGAHEAAAQDAAGNIATQMYGQAYDNDMNRMLSAYNAERDNMLRGTALSPTYAQQDYTDIAALSEAGTAKENYAQSLINADIDKYNYNAGRDLMNLQNYGALVSGNYGLSGESTATGNAGRSNPLGNVLGGALSGAGMGYLLGGQTGGLWGGGLGGLLGLF